MKRFLTLPMVVIGILLITACGTITQSTDTRTLIPADANLIAQVQVAKILDDPDFAELYEQTPKSSDDPQSLDELLEKARAEMGIDFRQFTAAFLFGDVTREDEYFAVIADGPVNEDVMVAAINASGEASLVPTDFSGIQIYTDESNDNGPALVFLDSNTSVVGTLPAVQDVISVYQGNAPAVSGQVYDTFRDLGTPLGSMAVAIPPEVLAEFEDSMGAGQGFGMIPAVDSVKDIEVLGFMVDKLGDEIKLEAQLDFVNASSAAQMGNTLDGLLKLASGFVPDEATRTLLSKLELNVTGNTITVSLQASIVEWQEVARGMEPEIGIPY